MKFRKQERLTLIMNTEKVHFTFHYAKIILTMTKLFSLCCTPIQNVCHRRKSSSFGIHWPLIWSIINSISHRAQKKRPYKQFCLEINLLITYEQQHLSTTK